MMSTIKIKTSIRVTPQCYAYTTPGVLAHEGWTKIGFTERDVETRIKEQTHTVGIEHKIWWNCRAAYMTEPFETFTDKDFHAYLKKLGILRQDGTEWFHIEPNQAKRDFIDFTQNHGVIDTDKEAPVIAYRLRDEQNSAVEQTLAYFHCHKLGEFLWNAKPRFGKTLASYDLCKRLKATNILIVTNRPAIANSWYSDYETFLGPQSGYLFVSNVDSIKNKPHVLSREKYVQYVDDNAKGCIEFVSLQDLKGSIYFGGKYDKLAEVSAEKGVHWDILIIDEAHEGVDTYKTDTAFNHIKRKWTLHLSGTPFKALASEKFPEDAIYNWTYADEQKKKRDWDDSSELENPYINLPKLNLYTYQMSEIVQTKVRQGIELAEHDIEEYAFDLNEFFATTEAGKFIHDADVDTFLDALTRQEKFPFSTPTLQEELKHTFWLLNRVASAKALAKKLKMHPVFKEYQIILAAGDGKLDDDDENEKAFDKVKQAIQDYDKTITLSVGQLTTGVTVPEWTAVLMLSNMASPFLYMQAAFRAQNPCLFHDNKGNTYRKQNAYVFDFDPARTLTIFEQFANDLIPETSGDKGDLDQRKQHVRELLNFFPVYGEDENGSMIELDAEKVLAIPRHIHAKEVVERGFMSNFLFANISGIFGAPKEVIDLINGMQAMEEPKKLSSVPIDEDTEERLYLNEKGEVEVPNERIIGTAKDIFGDKVYGDIDQKLIETMDDITKQTGFIKDPQKDELQRLQEAFAKPIAKTLMDTAKQKYGSELKKSTQHYLEHKIKETTNTVICRAYGDYTIRDHQLKKEQEDKLTAAQKAGASMQNISYLDEMYTQRREQNRQDMMQDIHKQLHSDDTVKKAAETIIKTVETEKMNKQKKTIEGDIRDHLRGFSRTIPAFLMAYGDETTTLANFDSLVPADVFWEVTVNPQTGKGITLDDFRFLRDGGDYKDKKTGEMKHFNGHLFDEVVFNDAVQKFMTKRIELANYFDEEQRQDIFDYIPPQRTNQIFTPKRVVKEMVDLLEQENPGCFDDPNATFADLYMKSGLYITEIVKRLYRSQKMKQLFPNDTDRIHHILEKQVYGMAPSRIIYLIATNYILGFDKNVKIHHTHFVQEDAAEAAKNGTLQERVDVHFGK